MQTGSRRSGNGALDLWLRVRLAVGDQERRGVHRQAMQWVLVSPVPCTFAADSGLVQPRLPVRQVRLFRSNL